jgi:hypothetical protein
MFRKDENTLLKELDELKKYYHKNAQKLNNQLKKVRVVKTKFAQGKIDRSKFIYWDAFESMAGKGDQRFNDLKKAALETMSESDRFYVLAVENGEFEKLKTARGRKKKQNCDSITQA